MVGGGLFFVLFFKHITHFLIIFSPLILRDDIVTDGNIRDEIFLNVSRTEEEYIVAPPGNIPIEDRSDPLYQEAEKEKKHNVQI